MAEVSAQSPPFSFLRCRLASKAGDVALHAWLIDEANRRGDHGAFNREVSTGVPTDGITDEEVLVALLMPQAEADARTWKLVVRMLQSGRLDPLRLASLARRERGDVMLAWLLARVPRTEWGPALEAVTQALRPPGHLGPVTVVWDASRLVRRPLTKGTSWRRTPS